MTKELILEQAKELDFEGLKAWANERNDIYDFYIKNVARTIYAVELDFHEDRPCLEGSFLGKDYQRFYGEIVLYFSADGKNVTFTDYLKEAQVQAHCTQSEAIGLDDMGYCLSGDYCSNFLFHVMDSLSRGILETYLRQENRIFYSGALPTYIKHKGGESYFVAIENFVAYFDDDDKFLYAKVDSNLPWAYKKEWSCTNMSIKNILTAGDVIAQVRGDLNDESMSVKEFLAYCKENELFVEEIEGLIPAFNVYLTQVTRWFKGDDGKWYTRIDYLKDDCVQIYFNDYKHNRFLVGKVSSPHGVSFEKTLDSALVLTGKGYRPL